MAFLGQICSETFINFQVLLKMSSIVDKMFTAQIEKCFRQKLSDYLVTAKSFLAAFWDSMLYSVRGSENVFLLMLKYTIFTLGSN